MSPMDDLQERTRRELDRVAIGPLPPVDGIVNRARALRRRRYGSYFLGAIVALVAAGFMFAREIDSPQRTQVARPSDAIGQTPPTQPGDLNGECPPRGPWSDPDCPGVQWVREVLTRAGFAITGDTGSALVARGERSSFDMHAFTDNRRNPPAHLILQEKVDGLKVYGRDITLWWEIRFSSPFRG